VTQLPQRLSRRLFLVLGAYAEALLVSWLTVVCRNTASLQPHAPVPTLAAASDISSAGEGVHGVFFQPLFTALSLGLFFFFLK